MRPAIERIGSSALRARLDERGAEIDYEMVLEAVLEQSAGLAAVVERLEALEVRMEVLEVLEVAKFEEVSGRGEN